MSTSTSVAPIRKVYQSSRNWVFTLNNPDEFVPEVALKDIFKFLIYQVEKGENGTIHQQGYICFKVSQRITKLKKLIPRAHWEIRKGTHEQAVAYCSKAETRVSGPHSFGDAPAQGKRTDLDAVKETIDAGGCLMDIADNHFTSFVKYERGIKSYMTMKAPKRETKSKVYVLWGPTGTGKSFWCESEAPNAYWYYPQKDGKWWDGYEGQEDVIIDEFYGGIMWSIFLRLLDRYPMNVEHKGASVNFNPKRIFITSNKHPRDWYPGKDGLYETLERRLDCIMHCPRFGQRFQTNMPVPGVPLPPMEEYLAWFTELPKPVDISDSVVSPSTPLLLSEFRSQVLNPDYEERFPFLASPPTELSPTPLVCNEELSDSDSDVEYPFPRSNRVLGQRAPFQSPIVMTSYEPATPYVYPSWTGRKAGPAKGEDYQ